jgi:hypothetical protein
MTTISFSDGVRNSQLKTKPTTIVLLLEVSISACVKSKSEKFAFQPLALGVKNDQSERRKIDVLQTLIHSLPLSIALITCRLPQCATDSDISIKLAAARAAGRLVVAEMKASEGESAPSLSPLCLALVALTGPDQRSEVQRASMAALRAASRYGAAAMEPHLAELIPSLCSLVGAVQGPLKMAAERTLAATLQLGEDDHVASALISSGQVKGLAKTLLNDAYLRRISKMGAHREEDEDAEDRYGEEEG